MLLIKLLIVFFIAIILNQIFLANFNSKNIIEGLKINSVTKPSQPVNSNEKFTSCDCNNPNNVMILSQQNAGNIEVLKQQMNKLPELEKKVQDMSANLESLTTQVNGIIGQQKNVMDSKLSNTSLNFTGL